MDTAVSNGRRRLVAPAAGDRAPYAWQGPISRAPAIVSATRELPAAATEPLVTGNPDQTTASRADSVPSVENSFMYICIVNPILTLQNMTFDDLATC